MPNSQPVAIAGAVEGDVDEAVLRRLVEGVGAVTGPVYGKKGKQFLQTRIAGYNSAARFGPWAILVDLDQDAECAPPFRNDWLSQPAPKMCFRVVVRAIEAWLLADRERLSAFLGVPVSQIPQEPEMERDPKSTMVELAKRSRRRDIREDMAPRLGSGRRVGPAYVSRLIEFVASNENGWRPEVAERSSDSLRRCLACLRKLAPAR